jgi:glycosyltransferase involved in cell wall biosynthesis
MDIAKDDNPSKLVELVKNYESLRLLREILWKLGKWKSTKLEKWIFDFSPDILFFCAGDSGFAYNVCEYIKTKFKCKLVVYITDDYILPRNTLNPFWWIRRNYILNKMRKTVNSADLFMTISQKMSDIYKKLFEKNSIVVSNMTVSMRDDNRKNTEEDIITLVYTGGLHFKRFITLGLLGDSIKRYNISTSNRKVMLKVYSNQKPGPTILKVLNKEGASQYCGSLDVNQLKIVLNSCDVPVHVESFERKSIESTRLSISTKIPEYLSLGKPILAIGPNNIASMEYLQDAAYCITNPDSIYEDLLKFLTNDEIRYRLSQTAKNKYEKYHDKHILSKRFKDYLSGLSSGL